ncbi:hypothetical protein PHYPSEUDO_010827 [Phytophthora pseudosyringae]|uniref:RxLR effector PexRD54 WY domain-containing protein n=1 Tax=Phytophthora pseudosyringae TaxID=221518 RepID=A0A8T1WC87_9STRA|nr:hypothetical protein PHYPSEUDO_010827 [Phytophthora pseudosyringae]
MRQPCCMLLVVTAFLANSNGAMGTQTISLDHGSSSRLVTAGSHEVPTGRTSPKARYEDEERGNNMSAVELLTSSLKSTVPYSQLEAWFKHGVSADEVFKLLLLDNAADDVLASPQLSAWVSYMKLFNQANPTKKTSLIGTLTAHYRDEGLAKIIEAAKQVPSTARVAKHLQTEQTQRWIGQRWSPDDVFALLKLDEAGDQLFAQPQVLTWMKYLDDFNGAHLNEHITVFAALTTHFDEKTLAQMLIEAKKIPSTEKIAIGVQAEQIKKWLHDTKSPSDVFTLLDLKDEGSSLFTSPLFTAWLKYTDEFNMLDPEAKAVLSFSTLKKHYSDDALAKMVIAASKAPSTSNLAKRLHSEQLREWYSSLKPPELVFKALKLDKTGSKLLERSLFTVWKEYVEFISTMDPRIKANLLTPLIKVYGERKLAKILVAAENVPGTKKLAMDLQDKQLNRWLAEKKSPTTVYSLLRVEGTAANDASRLLYDKYVEGFKILP